MTLGTAAAVATATTTIGAASAEAATVFGKQAPAAPLGMTGTIVGRHRNLFRSFALTGAGGVGIVTVGTTRYAVTLNTGNATDTIQVFNADTGVLHYKASTPVKAADTFAHDGKGNIYVPSGTALMVVSVPNKTVRRVDAAPAGVTSFYDLKFDYKGRLWAGTYPAGVAVCLDPATGAELARTPRLGTGNQYVRQLSMSPDRKVVWAGTGTADPDLFRIGVDTPSASVRVTIPNRVPNTFVLGVVARGRKVFVWTEKEAGGEAVSVYDTVARTWGASPAGICGRSITEPDDAGYVYVNAYSYLKRFRPGDATMVAQTVATVPDRITVVTALGDSTVYLFKQGPSELSAARRSTSGSALSRVNYQVVPGPLATQSMVIDPGANTAYAGGYRGDGLCATNLATGVFAHSASTSRIEQAEGMVVDQDSLYVGSYGSAVIVKHDKAAGVASSTAYQKLAELGDSHKQSRPYAWASTTSHVVFGTVPEYGYRGGALGTIERATGSVTVYNRIIPELSIVGLVGSGNTVYGTTSCLGGYGSDVYAGDAVVFAADAPTGKVLWTRALTGVKDVYGPILMNGKLYAATANSVVELRASDGVPLRTFVLSTRTGQVGWHAVELAQIPGTTRLVHLTGGVVRVLQTATGQSGTVLTGANQHIGFDAQNAMWVTVGNDLVKLRMDLSPSPEAIRTKYAALGGASTLGYPEGPQQTLTTESGLLQKFFRNGKATSIYWSSALGAHAVTSSGAIGKKFTADGNAHNGYGLPSTDETSFTGGTYQVFSKVGRGVTSVYSTPTHGTFAVKEFRAIGKSWAAAGREKGWGWPVEDEHYVGSELVQRFSKGVTAHYVSGKAVWTTAA
ncbi:hypothetical protein [Kocuria sp. U4B]